MFKQRFFARFLKAGQPNAFGQDRGSQIAFFGRAFVASASVGIAADLLITDETLAPVYERLRTFGKILESKSEEYGFSIPFISYAFST